MKLSLLTCITVVGVAREEFGIQRVGVLGKGYKDLQIKQIMVSFSNSVIDKFFFELLTIPLQGKWTKKGVLENELQAKTWIRNQHVANYIIKWNQYAKHIRV